jgi:formate dehydrogenase subunit gamma
MNAVSSDSPIEVLHTIHEILLRHTGVQGALLPVLHDIQDVLGYIPADSVSEIATALNLSRAEVHGVITYYHHFRLTKPGKHIVRICRAEACQSMGAEALMAHAEKHLACAMHHTTADGVFTLEAAYCLGLCASSPAMSIDDEVHARVNTTDFNALIAEYRGQA